MKVNEIVLQLSYRPAKSDVLRNKKLMRLNANRQKIETSFTSLRTAPNPRSITVGHIDDYKVNAIKW